MCLSKQYLNSDYIIYEDGRCYSNKSHKFLTPQLSVKYPTYNLTIDGVKKKTKIHRMVAITFLDNPENKPYVNHIDGNTHNYNLCNLEWTTEKENSQHAVTNNLYKKSDQTKNLLKDNLIENEIWVDIIDYPNYQISNYGRIINKQTLVLKKTPLDNRGYPHVNLWKNGKGKTCQVHRLEYQAFFPEEDLTGLVINHIDGDKTNNCLTNLEKATFQQNNLHAVYEIKTNNCAKQVVMMDKDYNELKVFQSIAEAQRETGFYCISRAIKKGYSTQGFYWKIKD